MALTQDDCKTVAAILTNAADDLPAGAMSVRATLQVMVREYDRAANCCDYADEAGLPYEIVGAGGLARGSSVMLPGGRGEVRRQSATGVEVRVDGFWGWEDISSNATPMVAV